MRRRKKDEAAVSRLVSLSEIAATLGSSAVAEDALRAALGIVMREMGVAAGALFTRGEGGAWAPRVARGLSPGPSTLPGLDAQDDLVTLGAGAEAHDRHGLALLLPIRRRERTIAVLGLGPRAGGGAYGAEEETFLRGVASSLAAKLESGLQDEELRRAHQRLSVKAYELQNLFDLTRELTGRFAEEAIQKLVVTTVMGHFVVSRCAIFLWGPGGLLLGHGRGLRRDLDSAPIPPGAMQASLESLGSPTRVSELPADALRRRLEDARLVLAVPMSAGQRLDGILAIGERASGLPFSDEDLQVAQTLAQQGMAALENARLQRVREEKERQDRELQLAREIQRSLLPPTAPEARGFEVAGESRPCFEVGGDSYDWIPLSGKRLALVVADVAGKGTPASLLMASVHAFVHALAGTAAPARAIERLNRFLFARTQASRFVTLFYAELDTGSRRLAYVNAGHVPPFRVAADGTVDRLWQGGAALGLLPDEEYEVGEIALGTGDVVAIVTDGVTEAMSPEDREFGDDRLEEELLRLSASGASAILAGLVSAVEAWAGSRGSSDDLTALILKVR
jgi:sigma-B regulation protein RsbU (phosphoserine phosphatase)